VWSSSDEDERTGSPAARHLSRDEPYAPPARPQARRGGPLADRPSCATGSSSARRRRVGCVVRAFRKLDVQVDKHSHLPEEHGPRVRRVDRRRRVRRPPPPRLRGRAFKIPSGSMIRLSRSEITFSSQVHLRAAIPFTYRFCATLRPRRGEVVVFVFPRTSARTYQRIVGVGGDVLEMRNGVLFVNGHEVEHAPCARWSTRSPTRSPTRARAHGSCTRTMDRAGQRIQYHVLYAGSEADSRRTGPRAVRRPLRHGRQPRQQPRQPPMGGVPLETSG